MLSSTMAKPTGMMVPLGRPLPVPMILNRLRNQPPTPLREGQDTAMPPVMMEPRPRVISIVHSVAMKGGRFMMATIAPFSTPKHRPMTMVTSMPTHTGQPHCCTR